MPISAGDIVLKVVGDLSELNKDLDEVKQKGDEVKDHFDPASESIEKMGDKLKEAGEKAAGAGAAQEAVADGAKAAAGQIGGIGTALEAIGAAGEVAAGGIIAAFSVLIIAAFVEALADGAKALHSWMEGISDTEVAWHKYDLTVTNASLHMQGEIDKQQQKIIEMTQGPVAALDFALKHLETTAFQTFDTISKSVDQALKAMEESYSFLGLTNTFKDSSQDLKLFREELQTVMLEAQKAHPDDPLAAYNAALTVASKKEQDLTALIKQRTAASGLDSHAATDGLHAERKAVDDVILRLQAGIELDKKRAEAAADAKVVKARQEEVKAVEEQVSKIKLLEKTQVEGIEVVAAKAAAAGANDKKLAANAATAQVAAAFATRKAHEDALQAIINLYKQHHMAAKAAAAEEELHALRLKNSAAALTAEAKAIEGLDKEKVKLAKETIEAFKQQSDEAKKLESAYEMLNKIDPFSPQMKRVIQLNETLKQLGIQGYLTLNQRLIQAKNAEKALNDAGIHEGKIWLQVQAAKLKAIIALSNANGLAARKEIQQLHDIEKELKKFEGKSREVGKTWGDMMQEMRKDTEQFTLAIGDAFAAALTGQKSIGEAMIQASAHMLGQMASQWAQYFAAMGIADIWWHPAKGAAELTAAVLLEALAGVLGSVGSGGSSGGAATSGAGSGPSIDSSQKQNQPATPTSVPTTNAPRLAGGALVTSPTAAIVGDSMNGGSAREGVLPLDDPRAMQAIADEIATRIQGGGDHFHFHNRGIISADVMSKFAQKMSRQISTGRARFIASNSIRNTRKA